MDFLRSNSIQLNCVHQGSCNLTLLPWVTALSRPGPNLEDDATLRDCCFNGLSNTMREELQKFLQWRVWQDFWGLSNSQHRVGPPAAYRNIYFLMLIRMPLGNLDLLRQNGITQEIQNYLDHIYTFWSTLGDSEGPTPAHILRAIDDTTITNLQGLVPSLQPAKLESAFANGSFQDMTDDQKTEIWKVLSTRRVFVPSLYTLFEDFKFRLAGLRFLGAALISRGDGRYKSRNHAAQTWWSQRSGSGSWKADLLYAFRHITSYDVNAVRAVGKRTKLGSGGGLQLLKSGRIKVDTDSALAAFRRFLDRPLHPPARTDAYDTPAVPTQIYTDIPELEALWQWGKPPEGLYGLAREVYTLERMDDSEYSGLTHLRARTQFLLFSEPPRDVAAECSQYSTVSSAIFPAPVTSDYSTIGVINDPMTSPTLSMQGYTLESPNGILKSSGRVDKPLPEPPKVAEVYRIIYMNTRHVEETWSSRDEIVKRLKALDREFELQYEGDGKILVLDDAIKDLENNLESNKTLQAWERGRRQFV